MRNRMMSSIFAAVVVFFTFSTAIRAQAPKQIPRTPDGKPNFAGLWTGGGALDQAPRPGEQLDFEGQPLRRPTRLAIAKELPLTPYGREAVAYWTSFDGEYGGETGDPRFPEYHHPCGYDSSPADLGSPVEIVQDPRRVTMLHMSDNTKFWVRQLWVGREHPKDLTDYDPKWMGHSVAKWDGDTLVADTVRIRVGTQWGSLLDTRRGTPHSGELHMVERFQLVNPETLRVDRTLTDPKTFTRPLTDTRVYRLVKDWDNHIKDWEVIENHTVCVGGIYNEENDPWFENFEEITGNARGGGKK